ncbi:ATP-binding cassette domain-containing protein, partial [Bacillus pseudomycoides]
DEELYPIESLDHENVNKAIKQWMLNSTMFKEQQKKEILCEIENISFSYSQKDFTLRDITLSIQKGEIVALLGHNGAGKSTFAHTLTGMNKAKEGEIVLDNENISSWSIRKRGEVISYVMQNPNHMITQSTVWDEVAFSLKLKKTSSAEINKRVEDALRICGLYPFRNWPIQALSYGQKKRLTIASVLTRNPKLIILDEPTAGQDYFHYKQFMSCISLLAAQGISFIFITHDMNLALEYADRAVVLHKGKILANDTVPNVLTNSEVLQQANLQESSLTTLANLSKVPFPDVFVQMYMEAKRRGDYE